MISKVMEVRGERAHLLLLVVILPGVIAVDESLFKNEITLGDGILIGLAVIVLVYWIGRWAWLNWLAFPRSFSLVYTGLAYDPNVLEHDILETMTIPLGIHKFSIRVQSRFAVTIEDCNLRFVSSNDDGNVPDSTIVILEIKDNELTNATLRTRQLNFEPDRKGGTEIKYLPPFFKGIGECLWLTITVYAHREWSGFLSFCALDKNGTRRYARKPFNISGAS